jgi:hypothetical protein
VNAGDANVAAVAGSRGSLEHFGGEAQIYSVYAYAEYVGSFH